MVSTFSRRDSRTGIDLIIEIEAYSRRIKPQTPPHHLQPRQNIAAQVATIASDVVDGYRTACIHHSEAGCLGFPARYHGMPSVGPHFAEILLGITSSITLVFNTMQ